MNWKELKEFCSKLSEEQLSKKVILWREDEAITNIDAIQLDEDHYIESEYPEEGCFSMSDAEYKLKGNELEYPNGMAGFQKVYDKGHPILSEDFIADKSNNH